MLNRLKKHKTAAAASPAAAPKPSPSSTTVIQDKTKKSYYKKLPSLKGLRQEVTQKNRKTIAKAEKIKGEFQAKKIGIEETFLSIFKLHKENTPGHKAALIARQVILGALAKGISPSFVLRFCSNYFAKKIKLEPRSDKAKTSSSSSASGSKTKALSKKPAHIHKKPKPPVKTVRKSPPREMELMESMEPGDEAPFVDDDVDIQIGCGPETKKTEHVAFDTSAKKEDKDLQERKKSEEAKKQTLELEALQMLADMNKEWLIEYHLKRNAEPEPEPEQREEKAEYAEMETESSEPPPPANAADKQELEMNVEPPKPATTEDASKDPKPEGLESPGKKRKREEETLSEEDYSAILGDLSDILTIHYTPGNEENEDEDAIVNLNLTFPTADDYPLSLPRLSISAPANTQVSISVAQAPTSHSGNSTGSSGSNSQPVPAAITITTPLPSRPAPIQLAELDSFPLGARHQEEYSPTMELPPSPTSASAVSKSALPEPQPVLAPSQGPAQVRTPTRAQVSPTSTARVSQINLHREIQRPKKKVDKEKQKEKRMDRLLKSLTHWG